MEEIWNRIYVGNGQLKPNQFYIQKETVKWSENK